jgi:hypothetical protein
MALVAPHRRQRQPARRKDRPWSHRDDDGVAFDDLAARERDAAQCCARAAHQADDGIVSQDRAMHLRRAHQTCRERAGIDHRRRLGRAEPSRDRDPAGQPRSRGRTARGIVLRGVTAVGRQTPISPRIAEPGGKLELGRTAYFGLFTNLTNLTNLSKIAIFIP